LLPALGSNILLDISFFISLSLCSPLNFTDCVSYLYKTTYTIKGLDWSILMLTSQIDGKRQKSQLRNTSISGISSPLIFFENEI
jgi:hypothetical protein